MLISDPISQSPSKIEKPVLLDKFKQKLGDDVNKHISIAIVLVS